MPGLLEQFSCLAEAVFKSFMERCPCYAEMRLVQGLVRQTRVQYAYIDQQTASEIRLVISKFRASYSGRFAAVPAWQNTLTSHTRVGQDLCQLVKGRRLFTIRDFVKKQIERFVSQYRLQ